LLNRNPQSLSKSSPNRRKTALSNDRKTTLLGVAFGALTAAQIDPARLLHGDKGQILKAIGALTATVWGYYTNKH